MRYRLSAAAATLGLLTACGASDKPAADTTAAAAAPAQTVAAAPTVITVTAKDYAFDAPDTVASGLVTIKLVNQGPDLHHVQLLKIDEGHTYAELTEGLKHMKPGSPPPPWVHDVAGPNSPVPGGGEASIMEDLAPGNYALLCFIPAADGVPHVMKGMIRGLTVTPSTTTAAAAPTADIDIKMTDYAWAVTPDISAGKHVIRIQNDAEQSHEMFLAKLAPGKKVEDLPKWVMERKGPPPAQPMGGISGMSKGAVAYIPVDLAPGEYGLFCFLPDAKDGKEHVAHGMIKQFAVK